MESEKLPAWLAGLDEEDLKFIHRFLLASGSLKEVAGQYGVSYPTVRLRLDRLIDKVKMNEEPEQDPYVDLVKRLALKDQVSFEAAKLLIEAYRRQKEEA